MQFSNKCSEDGWKYICLDLATFHLWLNDREWFRRNWKIKDALYIILQQPVLSGGPTTSILDAANFFRLLGLVLLGWWGPGGRLRGSRELTARGSRVTPGSLRLLGEEVEEEEEGPWELGFIVTPSSSFCEARELFEVFKEVAVLPATRFWDLVRFKSAKVPGGKWICSAMLWCTIIHNNYT